MKIIMTRDEVLYAIQEMERTSFIANDPRVSRIDPNASDKILLDAFCLSGLARDYFPYANEEDISIEKGPEGP